MIRPEVFEAQISVLERFYKRSQDEMGRETILHALDDRMSTADFILACERAMEIHEFFPSAKQLYELAHGTVEHKAEREWAEILRAIREADRADITAPAKTALDSIGTLHYLREMTATALAFARRDFVAAYRATVANADRENDYTKRGLELPELRGKIGVDDRGAFAVLNPGRRVMTTEELEEADRARLAALPPVRGNSAFHVKRGLVAPRPLPDPADRAESERLVREALLKRDSA